MALDTGNHVTCMLVRHTSMPCSPYKLSLFVAQAWLVHCTNLHVHRNTYRLVVKTRTYVWAYTYVRIGLHIRMYRLTHTYVQSTPSPHQVASSSSPFTLSFLVKLSINQPVKNDRASPHDPFNHATQVLSHLPSAVSAILLLFANERTLKGE